MDDIEFCDECGQPRHSHNIDCAGARYIPGAELSDGGMGVRCPVVGCAFLLDCSERSGEGARSAFFHHLEWHERTKTRAKRPVTQPPQQTKTNYQSADGAIDWEAWQDELRACLQPLPPGVRWIATRVITHCVRSLEGVQW